MSKFIYKLGLQAKDKVTGYKGIITGRCEHITGCNTYGLKAKMDKDGKTNESEWIDEGMVEITGKGITQKSVTAKDNGGPLSEHPKG